MKIGIIGLGLIGGSFALALKKKCLAQHIIGVDSSAEHASTALSIGLVDEILPLPEACAQAQVIIVAIPIDRSKAVIAEALNHAKPDALVIDMGSAKQAICEYVATHPKRAQFVAAHPMAGTEHSGPLAAKDDLYEGKKAIICEKDRCSDFALTKALALFHSLGMHISFMNPKEHDKHAAYISHLSHITSFTLGLTVLEAEKDDAYILSMAGSGFASTVRLAKSSPDMWTPIFLENKKSILDALQQYMKQLALFKEAIEQEDASKLHSMMAQANDIRRIL